jgi:hypothetical protein
MKRAIDCAPASFLQKFLFLDVLALLQIQTVHSNE